MQCKRWVAALLAIYIGLSFSGCKEKINVNKIKLNNEIKGNITLWSDDASLKALMNAKEKYKAVQPKVNISIENLNNDDNILDKITKNIASNSDKVDAAVIDEQFIPSLTNLYSNSFEDLSKNISDIKDNFTKNSIGNVSYKDKITAYPWYDYPVCIFYRKDILSKYGINVDDIKTWDDFIESGKTIDKASSGKIKMLGVNENSDDMFKILLNELNGVYRDKNDSCVLNSEKSTKSMLLLKKFKDNSISKGLNDNNGVLSELQNGTVVSAVIQIQNVQEFQSKFPDLKGIMQISSLPSFDIGGNRAASFGGRGIAIFKSTKNDDAINDFSKFTVSDSKLVIDNLRNNNIFPSYSATYKNSYYDTENNFFNNEKVLRIYANTNNDAYPIGFTSDFKTLNKNIIETQKKIFSGTDIADAMQKLTAQNNVQ